ncbi:MAG: methyl-accepting chemotaxis protein [Candidatus Hodarchaeales archaeon]
MSLLQNIGILGLDQKALEIISTLFVLVLIIVPILILVVYKIWGDSWITRIISAIVIMASYSSCVAYIIALVSYIESVSSLDVAFLIFLVVSIGIVILIGLGYMLRKDIILPLHSLMKMTKEVEEGKLYLEIPEEYTKNKGKGELLALSEAYFNMVKNLANIIQSVYHTATNVSSQSEELASISEEVNALSEEIAATVTEISKGASIQTEYSSQGIQDIQEMSEAVENAIQDIKKTTIVIEEIAKQTNILALNAAIEAARAGEAGRGFAVVADNVRRLAEETSKNSTDISALTNEIVSSIGGSVNKIQETFQNFSAQSEEFSASSEEVAAGTEEQTASMTQLTASAQELTRMGQELTEKISIFQVIE